VSDINQSSQAAFSGTVPVRVRFRCIATRPLRTADCTNQPSIFRSRPALEKHLAEIPVSHGIGRRLQLLLSCNADAGPVTT